MPKWYDDGVRVQLSVSTAGDFVALGTRTEYPFVNSGGGIPVGWIYYTGNGAATGDVNWTCANGRFSVSNASTTSSNVNKIYGIWRQFPVTYGKRYVLWVQTRTMENKAGGKWNVYYQFNNTGPMYGLSGVTGSEFEQIACYMLPTDSSVTSITVYLRNYYTIPVGENERFDWGMQWQLPALVTFDSTYPEPTWKDVTCDVQSFNVAYGRSKFTGRFEVASAQIGVTNVDGEFTYQSVHPWGLRPGRFVKVTVTGPNPPTIYNQFYGLIDSIQDSFPIDGKNTAILNCIDTSSLLSTQTVPTISSLSDVQYSGLRFRGILDNVAWHPGKRTFDQGVYYQQGVFQSGRTIRDELGITADSEGAYFWTDRMGVLTYYDRNYLTNTTRASYVQADLMAECPTFIDEVKFIFPGVQGNSMVLDYENAYAFNTTVDIRARVSIDDIANTNRQTLATQDSRWDFRLLNGARRMEFNNGVSSATSTVDFPYANGVICWVRCVYNRANGTVDFYVNPDQDNPPITWTRLGTQVTITGTMPTNTNPIRIGNVLTGFVQAFAGRLYDILLYDSTTPLFRLRPSYVPGTVANTQITIPLSNVISPGKVVNIAQTSTNVIIQHDTDIEPYHLIPVDNVPNGANPAIQHIKALETDWSRDRVVNDVQIANVGGSATQRVDHDSQQKYGPRTYQRFDFVNDNAHPEYNDQRTDDFMVGWTDSILRVNQVTFRPDPSTYGWALSMFLMDLVRVRYQHPTEGWGFAIATHIQGYVHSLTLGGWETTLNLDQPISFVYWNTPPDAAIGWDVSLWDQGIWDSGDKNAAYWTSGQVWTDSNTKWSE